MNKHQYFEEFSGLINGIYRDMQKLKSRGAEELGLKGVHVFCIPVAEELDLKKCAQAAGEKKIEMIQVKELLGLTGYIRGGCSPVGMKKKFPTIIDETAQLFDRIYVSAGQRGVQMILDPLKLAEYVEARFEDVTK